MTWNNFTFGGDVKLAMMCFRVWGWERFCSLVFSRIRLALLMGRWRDRGSHYLSVGAAAGRWWWVHSWMYWPICFKNRRLKEAGLMELIVQHPDLSEPISFQPLNSWRSTSDQQLNPSIPYTLSQLSSWLFLTLGIMLTSFRHVAFGVLPPLFNSILTPLLVGLSDIDHTMKLFLYYTVMYS